MFLKGFAALVFSVSCKWLHFARGYAFVCFHMCFPVLFFSFYFAASCVHVYLLVFSCLSVTLSTLEMSVAFSIQICYILNKPYVVVAL
jgi:hypothetical protein